jgi:hypothetical protein
VGRMECWNGEVFEMKALDEMKEINLNYAFYITFAITKTMFPCEMEDGGSKKEQFVFNDKYDKATVLWNSAEKRGYSSKS